MEPFHTQFNLTKDYLAECFDESLPHGKSAKPNLLLPIAAIALGAGLFVYAQSFKIVGTMFIAFAVLELVHIRYRRAWWLARQRWGNNANNVVTLTIDDTGVTAKNLSSQTILYWQDIERIIETKRGLILIAKNANQQYLSKSLFTKELIATILANVPNQNTGVTSRP